MISSTYHERQMTFKVYITRGKAEQVSCSSPTYFDLMEVLNAEMIINT